MSSGDFDVIKNAQSGWVCPKCGNVMAPSMVYCIFCSTTKTTSKLTDSTAKEETAEVKLLLEGE